MATQVLRLRPPTVLESPHFLFIFATRSNGSVYPTGCALALIMDMFKWKGVHKLVISCQVFDIEQVTTMLRHRLIGLPFLPVHLVVFRIFITFHISNTMLDYNQT